MNQPVTPLNQAGPGEPIARVLSLGVGVQSVTLALMSAAGELDALDAAVFADTRGERQATYAYLWQLAPRLPFPVRVVSRGDLAEDTLSAVKGGTERRCSNPPLYGYMPDGKKTMLRRKCTRDYKARVCDRELRRIVGVSPRGRVPGWVEQWMGISTDEAARMRVSPVRWRRLRYPLIELGMSRVDCLRWLEDNSHDVPPKSACVYCPYRSNRGWAALRERGGPDWGKAVAFDEGIRDGLTGADAEQLFTWRGFEPLTEADFGEQDLDGFDDECEGYCGV